VCGIHPAGLVEPGKPSCDALMYALVKVARTADLGSNAHDMALLALRSEIEDAHKEMTQYRALCAARPHMMLAIDFMDMLKGDFTFGDAHVDPEDLAAFYMADVRERLREKD